MDPAVVVVPREWTPAAWIVFSLALLTLIALAKWEGPRGPDDSSGDPTSR